LINHYNWNKLLCHYFIFISRCPFPGCSSTEFIIKKNLVRDFNFSQKIALKIKEAQKRKDFTTLASMPDQENAVNLEDLVDQPD